MNTRRRPRMLRRLARLLVLLGAPCVAGAAAPSSDSGPSLAPLFGDHAVLQRDKADPVWGRAQPGDAISVTFHGRTERATAGADGRWLVRIGPFPASSEPS
ncbi:MAG: hypothetical protein WAN79_10140, partial [Opitutaceae bacterium]